MESVLARRWALAGSAGRVEAVNSAGYGLDDSNPGGGSLLQSRGVPTDPAADGA